MERQCNGKPETGEYDGKIDVYPNHIEEYSSETVTGISMTIIIRTIRGTDQKYMVWREGIVNLWVGLSPEMQQIPEESGGVDMIFISGNRNMRDGRGLGLQTASPQWGQPMFF